MKHLFGIMRRNDQMLVLIYLVGRFKEIKNLVQLLKNRGVGGKQRIIGINTCGGLVKVSGTDKSISLKTFVLFAFYQADLAMDF